MTSVIPDNVTLTTSALLIDGEDAPTNTTTTEPTLIRNLEEDWKNLSTESFVL